MKVFSSDYNNILTKVNEELEKRGWRVENPRDADIFLLWQDVRGEMKRLAEIAVNYLRKPVLVVQHGRGATRDYEAPNKFPFIGTKFLAWGPTEKERMKKAGYGDRTTVVGCPLLTLMAPKIPKVY